MRLLVQGILAMTLPSIGSVYAGTPDHVTSNLQIQIPSTLFKSGGYEHREALFGTPPYGGSINQPLYYAGSDLCDSTTVDPRKGYPSRPNDETGKQAAWPAPFILMMDRGNCSFVQKVRNAQHLGAAGVIIADNICLCNDMECIKHYREDHSGSDTIPCEQNEPIMADDGSGGDIDIPAFLVMKHDADIWKEQMMEEDQKIQLQMSWTLPAPDDRVEYELWTTPSEHVSEEFQKNWKNVARVFEKHIYFTPREYLYDGSRFDCEVEKNRVICDSLCTNQWKYCAMDPDYNINQGTSGADLVVESLRRICVWKHYGAEDGIGIKYWDYISEFFTRCDNVDFFSNKSCVDDALKRAKVDVNTIEHCMEDSGGVQAGRNTFLDLEIAAQARRGVVILPTIYVNSVALRGALTENTLITAICAGFVGDTAPAVCSMCASCPDKVGCVTSGGVCKDGPKGLPSGGAGAGGDSVSKRSFGLTLLALTAMFGAAAYVNWKRSKDDIQSEVRGILSEYMPLGGGKDEEGGIESPMEFARPAGSSSFLT